MHCTVVTVHFIADWCINNQQMLYIRWICGTKIYTILHNTTPFLCEFQTSGDTPSFQPTESWCTQSEPSEMEITYYKYKVNTKLDR